MTLYKLSSCNSTLLLRNPAVIKAIQDAIVSQVLQDVKISNINTLRCFVTSISCLTGAATTSSSNSRGISKAISNINSIFSNSVNQILNAGGLRSLFTLQASQYASVTFKISYNLNTLNQTMISNAYKLISNSLSNAITQSQFTLTLQKYISLVGASLLNGAEAKSYSASSLIDFIVNRYPSFRPTTHAPVATVTTNATPIIAGAVVGGVLLCLLIAYIVYRLTKNNSAIPNEFFDPLRATTAVDFGAVYANKDEQGTAQTTNEIFKKQNIEGALDYNSPSPLSSHRGIFDLPPSPKTPKEEVTEAPEVLLPGEKSNSGVLVLGSNSKYVVQSVVALEALTIEDVAKLLKVLNLPTYIKDFKTNNVNGRVLNEIREPQDLEEFHIIMPGPVSRAFIKTLEQFRQKGISSTLLR